MSRLKNRLAPLFAVAVFLLPVAFAEAQTRLGDTELGFSFDLDDLTEGSDSQLRMTLRAGRYLGERFEIGLELGSNGTLDDVTETLSYRLFALYELNPGDTAVWYGRGGYSGLRFRGFDLDLLDAGFGLKTYLRDDTALYWETAYGYVLSGPLGADDRVRTVTGLVCTF